MHKYHGKTHFTQCLRDMPPHVGGKIEKAEGICDTCTRKWATQTRRRKKNGSHVSKQQQVEVPRGVRDRVTRQGNRAGV